MAVTVRDRGYDAMMRRVRGASQQAQPPVVDVGVLGAEAAKPHPSSEGALTVADVASANEFGVGVPERSFIRSYVDENRDAVEALLQAACKATIAGHAPSATSALEGVGLKITANIVRRINAHIDPENSPATVERKGSSTPLIDTGQLKSSISYLVRRAT